MKQTKDVRYKALFNRFPYVSYPYWTDGGILMQPRDPFLFIVVKWEIIPDQFVEHKKGEKEHHGEAETNLYNFSDGHSLADSLPHCLQDNLFHLFLLNIWQQIDAYSNK